MRATTEAPSTFIADTAQFVRHYPLGIVAAAFGGGLLVGWLIARELKTGRYAGSEQREQQASEEKAKRRAISRWEGEGGRVIFNEEGQSEEINREA
jgi:hypothetical protein